MSLPFSLHTAKIETSSGSGDKWEARTYSTVEANVPCIFAKPSTGDVQSAQGQQIVTQLSCFLDPSVSVTADDRITNLETGEVYLVGWVHHRVGFGLDRKEAGLRQVEGV